MVGNDSGGAVSPELAAAVAAVAGKTPIGWRPVAGGYTNARRLVVRFADGSSAFVKGAVSDDTARWIRQERQIYETLGDADFLAAYQGRGDDTTGQPFLILEDLSDAHWPPPWQAGQIDAVLTALEQVRARRGPLLNALPGSAELAADNRWKMVAADPTPFLSLNLCSAQWLESALPPLIQASDAAPFAGDELLHHDLRSDNVCFCPHKSGVRAVIVDWNWARRGNGVLDIAGWLPSLHSEGGPAPEEVSPEAGVFAAWLAGYFASQAGLPPIPAAPRVRSVQKAQLKSALPWAVRATELPPL